MAPPFLKDDEVLVAQIANILLYLGRRLGLAPRDEAGRLWAHQLQLTIADVVDEAQRYASPDRLEALLRGSARRSPATRRRFHRQSYPEVPWLLREGARAKPRRWPSHWTRASYCDLSPFQLGAGLRYAFPQAMTRLEPNFPRISNIHDRIAARPRLATYLKSARRIAFNEQGVFRHYPELDAATPE